MDHVGACTRIEEETEAETQAEEGESDVEIPQDQEPCQITETQTAADVRERPKTPAITEDALEELKLLSRIAANAPRPKEEKQPECDSESPPKSDTRADVASWQESAAQEETRPLADTKVDVESLSSGVGSTAELRRVAGSMYSKCFQQEALVTRVHHSSLCDDGNDAAKSEIEPYMEDADTNQTFFREEADLAFEQMLSAIQQDVESLSLSVDLIQKSKLQRIRDALRVGLASDASEQGSQLTFTACALRRPKFKLPLGTMRTTRTLIAIEMLLLLVQRFEEEDVLLALTEVIRSLFQSYASEQGVAPLRHSVALLTSVNITEVVLLTRRALMNQITGSSNDSLVNSANGQASARVNDIIIQSPANATTNKLLMQPQSQSQRLHFHQPHSQLVSSVSSSMLKTRQRQFGPPIPAPSQKTRLHQSYQVAGKTKRSPKSRTVAGSSSPSRKLHPQHPSRRDDREEQDGSGSPRRRSVLMEDGDHVILSERITAFQFRRKSPPHNKQHPAWKRHSQVFNVPPSTE